MGGSPGIQTIRCCSTGAMLPEGCDEMVIDLFRNSASPDGEAPAANPMARFDDGWETKYVAAFQKTDREARKVVVATDGLHNNFAPPPAKEETDEETPRERDLSKQSCGLAPWDKVW